LLGGNCTHLPGARGVHREHGTTTTHTRAALLALLGTSDVLVLQGTPAGSERRTASLNGHPAQATGPNPPSNILLQPMRPATHWANVPLLTANWDPDPAAPIPFTFTGPNPPQSLRSVRLLQRGVIQFGGPLGLGLTQMRHEAPRRFVVSGDDIRVGARLQLRVPAPAVPGTPPPYANLGTDTLLIELGLYPTSRFFETKRIWETTAEVDPMIAYALLLGGPNAPGVATAIDTPWIMTEPFQPAGFPAGTFDPATWNLFHVTVVNEDNSTSGGAWQQLKIQ
jgi:hypothetical protein